MKKSLIVIIIFAVLYLVFSILFHPFIPCIINEVTGLYCPGCGVTRMLISIIKLDFYQAFRYNPLLFVSLPFALILIIDYLYSKFKKRKPMYEKIDNKIWIAMIIILIIYGIVRNIYLPLAPTQIIK